MLFGGPEGRLVFGANGLVEERSTAPRGVASSVAWDGPIDVRGDKRRERERGGPQHK